MAKYICIYFAFIFLVLCAFANSLETTLIITETPIASNSSPTDELNDSTIFNLKETTAVDQFESTTENDDSIETTTDITKTTTTSRKTTTTSTTKKTTTTTKRTTSTTTKPIIINQSDLTCSSSNLDEAISTFANQKIFKLDNLDTKKHYILYKDIEDNLVLVKYKKCNSELCNCGIYIKFKDNNFAFIDACDSNIQIKNKFKLKYIDIQTNLRELIDCEYFVQNQTDASEWNNVKPSFGNLKCANLRNDCSYLAIRTNKLKNNFEVKVNINCDKTDPNAINQIEIRSLTDKFFKSGGLCGLFKNVQMNGVSCTNYINENECENSNQKLFEYWNYQMLTDSEEFDFNPNEIVRECVSDDKVQNLDTFMAETIQKNKAFQINNQNYILYKDTRDLLVTAKYQSCNSKEKCNCALYIRVSDNFPKYAFIDFCNGNASANNEFKYFDNDLIKSGILSNGNFPKINCNSTILNENNEKEWNNISFFKANFQCARLRSSLCETYMIKATIQDKTVKVKVNVKCGNGDNSNYGLQRITVIPETDIKHQTSGLCGNMVFNKKLNCSLHIEKDSEKFCMSDSTALGEAYQLLQNDYNWKLRLDGYAIDTECVLFNYDKAIQTFNGQMLKNKFFTNEKKNIVLYNYRQKLMVTAKFRLCRTGLYKEATYCTCGVYMRVNTEKNSHFAYVDVCKSKLLKNEFKFKYYNSTIHKKPEKYETLICNQTIKNENDDKEWDDIKTSFKYFKCAKLVSDCESYVIKTVGLDYNIKLKSELKCADSVDPISEIIINPAIVSEEESNGLCGPWSKKKTIECNFYDENGLCIKTGNSKSIVNYWNVKRLEEDGLLDQTEIDEEDLLDEPPPEKNVVLRNKFCLSQNDPHMKSIMNRPFEYHKPGEYILYELGQDFFITAAFRFCNGGAMCNCAIFITKDYENPQTAYIDFCNAADSSGVNFEGFDGNIFGIDRCRNTDNLRSIDQVFDDDWWEARKERTQFGYSSDPNAFLDCAVLPTKISGGLINSGSYFYRSNNEYKKNDFIVEVGVRGDSIDFIKVHPSKKSASMKVDPLNPDIGASQITGGLCGRWTSGFQFNPNYCDLFYRVGTVANHEEICVQRGAEMQSDFVNYWRVQNFLQSEAFLRKRSSKRSSQIQTRLEKIEDLKKKMYNKIKRDIDPVSADLICRSKLSFNNVTLSPEVENQKQEYIQMCIKDVLLSGREDWAEMHSSVLKEELLRIILRERKNYDENGIIKDEVLKEYGITCLNDCSGNGKCLKNPLCNFGGACEKIVECSCNKNFGSTDCSVNLLKEPEFEMVETCCDSHSMNCDKLIGIGPSFSTNDTLFYKLELLIPNLPDDAWVSTQNTDEGEASVIDSTKFEINYPFGFLPNIRLSKVIMRVGISYGIGDFSYRNVTFFDSNCRTCTNGYVDPKTVTDTCVSSKTGRCSQIVNGICDDPSPCSGGMDVGFLIQSSSRTNEEGFQMGKNSLSEIIGRLDTGADKVQVGFVLYSRRIRKTLSLARKDQANKNKRFFIEKAQQLPYMPFLATPFLRVLQYSNSEIFSIKRDSFVPRVAVLFNDASSTDDFAAVVQKANELKQQDIEIFTVGIGNDADLNKLNGIASNQNYVIHVENHREIYEKINEISQKLCSVNAKVYFNKEEKIISGKNDFRYFKIELVNLNSPFIEIETKEKKGRTNLYYSFSIQNPVFGNSDSFYRRNTSKRDGTLTENSYLIIPPENSNVLYFTIEGVAELNELNLVVKNIDL